MLPAVDNRLLPDINASYSRDTWTYSGTAVGLPVPKLVTTLKAPTATKVFRIPNNYTDAEHMGDAYFMEFANPDTDVLRSQVFGDTYERYYWASASGPPRVNSRARIVAGQPGLLLGMQPPGAFTATPTGGASTTLVSRAYVTTYVSFWGEEGPVSAPVLIPSMKQDASVSITMPGPPAADQYPAGPDRWVNRRRIYRTITATDGTTTYFLVDEIPQAQLTYTDVMTDLVLSAKSPLESTLWTGPPADLQGWVVMSNGIIAGWRENEIWFSEPFRPHAWPASYVLTTEYPIVGMGVTNQTLVVATKGYPYTVNGINPAAMTLTRLAGLLPCTSRGSIVPTVDGVYFSTPQGLALVAGNDVVIVTRELIRKDKWNALTPMNTLRAAQLGNAYYAFGAVIFGVFDINTFDNSAFAQADNSGSKTGIMLDPTSKQVAFNILSSDVPVTNVMLDSWTGEVLLIQSGNVYWLDIGDVAQPRVPFKWASKVFQTDNPENFQAAKIYFSKPNGLPPLNPVPDTTLNQELKADQWGLLRGYTLDDDTSLGNRRLRFCREIRKNGDLMRLPSGYKANFWQFEVETRLELLSMQVATSAKELKKV